jgi:hypothetical protein
MRACFLITCAGNTWDCYTKAVRGDSRRDLYAKILALCGLGLLSGAGALVDYWPLGIKFPNSLRVQAEPTVVGPLRLPESALASIQDESHGTRALSQGRSDALVQRTHARQEEPIPGSLPVVATPAALVPPAETVGLEAPPLPLYTLVRHDLPVVASIPLQALAPAPVWRSDLSDRTQIDSMDDGFLAEALRKTRTSIVRTGMKTGASVADAVRVVSNAVRWAF